MRVIGRLSHPHIVQARDARKVKGVHFPILEFVEGTDLGRVMVHLGPLPVADACEMVRQAALGL